MGWRRGKGEQENVLLAGGIEFPISYLEWIIRKDVLKGRSITSRFNGAGRCEESEPIQQGVSVRV